MHPETQIFAALNTGRQFQPPASTEYFTLTAPSDTHIWRKPSSPDITTAPILYTYLRHPFILAEVTITGRWDMEWDQGGLTIFAGSPPGTNQASVRNVPPRRRTLPNDLAEQDRPSTKWVKAGLEFTSGALHVSTTVATSQCGSDWCVTPIYQNCLPHEALPDSMTSLRVKFERIDDSLWIWYKLPNLPVNDDSPCSRTPSPAIAGAEWRKAREVMGFFLGVEPKTGVFVGCYASRPMRWESEGSIWVMNDSSDEVRGLDSRV